MPKRRNFKALGKALKEGGNRQSQEGVKRISLGKGCPNRREIPGNGKIKGINPFG